MADSGIFRINPLQGWQRDAILKATKLLRDRFGSPPGDADVLRAHDLLLEVLDPARRTTRLQKELTEATRQAATAAAHQPERRKRERRATVRRSVNAGPAPEQPERRKKERRNGERRNRK